MTETDRLRALLDERGMEHYDGTERTLWGYEQTGENTGIYRFAASEISGGFLQFDMFRITPEQAVEATLGRETCKWEPADFITEGEWWNTSCGESFTWEPDGTPRYCPNCGARVMEVADDSR